MRMPACLVAFLSFFLDPTCPSAAIGQSNQQSTIQLSFDSADPLPVFTGLARSMNCRLSLDHRVTKPVSILTQRVSPQAALDAICEDIGCHWSVTGGQLIVEPGKPEVSSSLASHSEPALTGLDFRLKSMVFVAVPLKLALIDVLRAAGVPYMLFGKFLSETPVVTLDVSGETAGDALKKILNNAGIKGFSVRQTLEQPPACFFCN